MKKLIGFVILVSACMASASGTRVGNGDDGRDLEGLTPIESGIIFDSRAEAIRRLKALNVQGIQGLGALLPEIENSQMLLADRDVRPISNDGEWERSEDLSQVYARTFAEPHSPTRFFPAALKLSREQLIALHTHEALHRALPADIREDENKVSMLTLALTSPSANFDRVNRVVKSTIQNTSHNESATTSGASRLTYVPPPNRDVEKTKFDLQTLGFMLNTGNYSVQKLAVEGSPLGILDLKGQAVEPQLGVSGMAVYGGGSYLMGPVSLSGRASMLSENKKMGPMVQVNLKSLEEQGANLSVTNRDVYTLGFFYETQRPNSYVLTTTTYTLADSSVAGFGPYGAIWSADVILGKKWGRFNLGVKFDFDHMQKTRVRDSFSLIQAGPDLSWKKGSFSINMTAGAVLNRRSNRTLKDLGDLAGHGDGYAQASIGIGYEI